MKVYSSNPRTNKAMYILATMSTDMIEAIIDTVNSKGRSLIADITDDDAGPPRPLAIFSDEYMTHTDFPPVWTGMMITVLAQLRTLKGDHDFYESVLKNAFSLPTELASPMAKKIETYDVLGGSETARSKMAWYSKMGAHLQEGVRRAGNDLARFFDTNWENDQDQEYDIDYLYELSLLGKTVDELMSRARLMKGQAAIAAGMGLFRASDGSNPSEGGDPYGDIYGDPQELAQIKLQDTMKPLMGSPLPEMLFGGLAKLLKIGDGASKTKLKNLLASGGAIKNAMGGQNASDPAMRNAIQNVITGNQTDVTAVDGPEISLKDISELMSTLKTNQSSGENGDSYARVRETYGDIAAENWRTGNIPGMMHNVVSLAGDAMESTGDPELDQAIYGDVLNEEGFSYGDVENDINKEMGGLFTRARINHNIRKGKRKQRKNARRDAKQANKDEQNQQLIGSKTFANNQSMSMTEQPASQMPVGAMTSQPGMTNDFPSNIQPDLGYQMPPDLYDYSQDMQQFYI